MPMGKIDVLEILRGAVASSRPFRASSCTVDRNYGSVMLGIISTLFEKQILRSSTF